MPTCVYCGQQYRFPYDRHKITRCPNYPINPRASCLYCGAAIEKGLRYPEHLIRECKRVPAPVLKELRADYKSIIGRLQVMGRGSPPTNRSVRSVRGGGRRTKPQ